MGPATSIVDTVLGLPASERARIALTIMDSLPPDAWEDADLIAEAERRDLEMEGGHVRELSHEEFIAGLRR